MTRPLLNQTGLLADLANLLALRPVFREPTSPIGTPERTRYIPRPVDDPVTGQELLMVGLAPDPDPESERTRVSTSDFRADEAIARLRNRGELTVIVEGGRPVGLVIPALAIGEPVAAETSVQAAASAAHASVPAPPPTAAPAGGDLVAKLNELARLKAEGILSDTEFESAKAKVLG